MVIYVYSSLIDSLHSNHRSALNASKMAALIARFAPHALSLVLLALALLALAPASTAAPLDDQLPDTTGLFFGKRAPSHPNMNNLLFGHRSLVDSLAAAASGQRAMSAEEAGYVCKAVRASCEKYRMWEEE